MADQFTKQVPNNWAVNLIRPTSTQFIDFQSNAPSLTDLQNNPGLQVPNLSPTETDLINRLVATGQANPNMLAAQRQLQQLTSGPIGSSPATVEGMQAFQNITAPQIMQAQALQGTASGGAALEAMGQGATAAALPLIQTEIANREAAVGQYSQLGQQQIMQLAAALEAAGMPREVALKQAFANYQQAEDRWKYQTDLQTRPLDPLLNNAFGSRSGSTMGAQDWVGFGLSTLGSLLGG